MTKLANVDIVARGIARHQPRLRLTVGQARYATSRKRAPK